MATGKTGKSLTGAELGRALLVALGWRFQDFYNGGGFWHKNGCTKRMQNAPCACAGEYYPPALESDRTAFWSEFEKWARQNARAYSSRWQWSYKHTFSIQPLTSKPSADDPWIHAEGESDLEAGCRAWLKAIEVVNKSTGTQSRLSI